jgi:integrase/recombinase XerC
VRRLLAAAAAQAEHRSVRVGSGHRRLPGDPGLAARDVALVRLLHDRALRRGEVVSLDLEHVVRDEGGHPKALLVRGKGRQQRTALTIPRAAAAALAAWLVHRGVAPGPLFLARGGRRRAGRLTERSVAKVLERLALLDGMLRVESRLVNGRVRRVREGVIVRPHGLRHTAITQALDRTNGDVRAVQVFSRHADPRVIMRYDDNREDIGGRIAELVADV